MAGYGLASCNITQSRTKDKILSLKATAKRRSEGKPCCGFLEFFLQGMLNAGDLHCHSNEVSVPAMEMNLFVTEVSSDFNI